MKSNNLAIKVESIPPLKSTPIFIYSFYPISWIHLVIYFNDYINNFFIYDIIFYYVSPYTYFCIVDKFNF